MLAIYVAGAVASYVQVITMGGVGRRVLFHLRNALFLKLQDLPVAFFNENKAGDLISRLNNDTDKLNQFVAQALMQFVGSVFLITGAAIFLVSLNIKLGLRRLNARVRRPAVDARNFGLDQAQEPGQPASAGRNEFGSAGKPE